MKKKWGLIILLLLFIVGLYYFKFNTKERILLKHTDDLILSYVVDLQKKDLRFFWKDESGKPFENFRNLKKELDQKGEKLLFAMNGGMFRKDLTPVGLYIENGTTYVKENRTAKGYGNFHMQPNGVFYIDIDNNGIICTTKNFENDNSIKFATQSGPMLVIDSTLHTRFNEGSKNTNVRNGVGVLPDGNLLFAMSKEPINFYDFASFFLSNGCKNALYLDGYVSKTYLPRENWKDLDGRFGVIIGEVR